MLVVTCIISLDCAVAAATEAGESTEALFKPLGDLTWSMANHFLFLGTYQGINVASPFNPDNMVARLPVAAYDGEWRPLIDIKYDRVRINAQPRLSTQFHSISNDRDTADADVWIRAASAQVRLTDELYVSGGREVLVWGPGQSIWPSNPFYLDNRRSQPFAQLVGHDLMRALYIPNSEWSFSLIYNSGGTDKDRQFVGFSDMVVGKVDFTREKFNGMMLAGKASSREPFMGGYIQWTANDSLILYAEGMAEFETAEVYPKRASTPINWELARRNGVLPGGTLLLGGSYTFKGGTTLYAEFVYNRSGYTSEEASDYFALGRDVINAVAVDQRLFPVARGLLQEASLPGLRLLRQRYLFFQINSTLDKANKISFLGRFTQNLDDGSSMTVGFLEWNLTEHFQPFVLGVYTNGGSNTEFGRFIHSMVNVGLRVFF